MITKASFRNFKALKSVDIELQRLTIIVGPNGSGKSSILEGIHNLCQRATNWVSQLYANFNQYETDHSRGTKGLIEFCVTLDDEKCLSIRLQSEAPTNDRGSLDLVQQSRIDALEWHAVNAGTLRSKMASRLLRFDPGRLRDPSYFPGTPKLETNGQGLASVVAYYRGRYPDVYQRIENGLRQVIPIVKQIKSDRVSIPYTELQNIQINGQQVRHAEPKTVMADSLLFDFVGADDVPAESTSEGTLIVLALLTELMSAKGPMVLLLDNLDHGLHPKAQFELIKLIRSLLDGNPDLQIVATAHSPYILEHLDAQEILLTALRADGTASCAPVNEHPDFDKWKNAMSPSEFWSHVGEDWISQRMLSGAGG